MLDRPGDPRMVGVLSRKAVFDVYNQEVLHKDVLGLKIKHQDTGMHDCLELPEAYGVQMFTPPPSIVGRSLREVELRRRYKTAVLAFKRKGYSGGDYNELPDPDRRIEPVDRLVVVGRKDDLDRLLEDVASDALLPDTEPRD